MSVDSPAPVGTAAGAPASTPAAASARPSTPAAAIAAARRAGSSIIRRVAHRVEGGAPGALESLAVPVPTTALRERFIEVVLDESTAALRRRTDDRMPGYDLQFAQQLTAESLLAAAQVLPGHRVLDIGGADGLLAVTAARRGAHVTTVVPTAGDAALIALRADLHGVSHLLDVVVGDITRATGVYDTVFCVEQLSAFTPAARAGLLVRIASLLEPAGVAVIQSVTLMDAHAEALPASLQGAVAPEALPTARELRDLVAGTPSLVEAELHSAREAYLATLAVAVDQLSPCAEDLGLRQLAAGLEARTLDISRITVRRAYLEARHVKDLDAELRALLG